MPNILIFGAPGSGKGTQSRLIIDRFQLNHISTGELLRREVASGTRLGQLADSYCIKGQLIPDDLMVDILASHLDSGRLDSSRGIIFDGFPRTLPQAHALTDLFADRHMTLDAVIGLEVPENLLFDRLIERGRIEGRTDDNPTTIARRIEVYNRQTLPLRDFYIREGKYIPIPAADSIAAIAARIANAIEVVQATKTSGIIS